MAIDRAVASVPSASEQSNKSASRSWVRANGWSWSSGRSTASALTPGPYGTGWVIAAGNAASVSVWQWGQVLANA